MIELIRSLMAFGVESEDGRAFYTLPVVGETMPPICIRRPDSARTDMEDRNIGCECCLSLEK